MKALNEFLSTKVKNTEVFYDKFPNTPKTNDVIEFLEYNGFKKNIDEYGTFAQLDHAIRNKAEYSKNDGFMVCEDIDEPDRKKWIRFWKHGEINEHNPIFFCRLLDDGHWVPESDKDFIASTYFEKDLDNIFDSQTKYKKYDEFVEIVNKHFEW